MGVTIRSLVLTGLLLLCGGSNAAAQSPSAGGISTPNLEHVKLYPLDGRANGAKLLGRYLYVTTGKTLEILDVAEPENPVRVGKLDFDLIDAYALATGYQEDVDTDGRVLIRSDSGQLQVIDVRDPSKPTIIGTLSGADNHTMSCVLSCTWIYGSEGALVDNRDPTKPRSAGVWEGDDFGISSSHDVTEVSPGIVLTATRPMYLLDARQNPEAPQVLAKSEPPGFVHGTRWPGQGTDDLALSGGESIGPSPRCESNPSSTFVTWDTRGWRESKTFKVIDEYALRTGDEGATASVWCTHWFDEHPQFSGGGLVTIAWYEQGIRLLEVARDGKITQTGYYLPHGGSIWDVRWITPRVLYTLDHHRGIDILRYTGDIPAPAPKATPPQPAAPRKPAFKRLIKWTSSKRCVTRRKLTVRARRYSADPVTEIVLSIKGKVARWARGSAAKKTVRLKRLPKGRKFTLRVEAVTHSGHRVAAKRTYKTCR